MVRPFMFHLSDLDRSLSSRRMWNGKICDASCTTTSTTIKQALIHRHCIPHSYNQYSMESRPPCMPNCIRTDIQMPSSRQPDATRHQASKTDCKSQEWIDLRDTHLSPARLAYGFPFSPRSRIPDHKTYPMVWNNGYYQQQPFHPTLQPRVLPPSVSNEIIAAHTSVRTSHSTLASATSQKGNDSQCIFSLHLSSG